MKLPNVSFYMVILTGSTNNNNGHDNLLQILNGVMVVATTILEDVVVGDPMLLVSRQLLIQERCYHRIKLLRSSTFYKTNSRKFQQIV